LVSDVTSTASYGALVVSGSATITNATIMLSGSSLDYGQSYLVVDAAGASAYAGNSVSAGSYYVLLAVQGDDLYARLGYAFKDIGKAAGSDAATMGTIMQDLQADPAFGDVLTNLSGASNEMTASFLTQIAPAQIGSGAAILDRAMVMSGQVDRAISGRSGTVGQSWRLWGQAMAGAAERGAEGSTEAYGMSTWGLALGADRRINGSTLLGGAVSWSQGWTGGKGGLAGNSNRVDTVQVTAYGAWSGGGVTIKGLAGVGFDSYDQKRVIAAMNETAVSGTSGRHYELKLDAGYDMAAGAFTVGPTASLKWLHLTTGDYTETGADVLDLSIGDNSLGQLRSTLGVRMATSVGTSIGTLVPELRLGWLHDFVADAVDTNAVVQGVGFSTSAFRASADGLSVGGGLSLLSRRNSSLSLGYDGDFRKGFRAHTAQLQVRIQF
jgi:outer membrane autotransporter protein